MLKRGNLELYVGIDESNHGRYPETIAAIFSSFYRDIQPHISLIKPTLQKKRTHQSLFGKFSKREFTFIQLNQDDLKKAPKKDLKGLILSSLIFPLIPFYEEHISIYIDGEISFQLAQNTKEIISEICNIPHQKISLRYGPQYDQIYPIVNLADELAHYIFRCKEENLSRNINKHSTKILW